MGDVDNRNQTQRPPGGRSRVFQDGYAGVKIRLFTLGRADINIKHRRAYGGHCGGAYGQGG